MMELATVDTCLTPAQGWAGSLHVQNLVSSLRLSMWSKFVESWCGGMGDICEWHGAQN